MPLSEGKIVGADFEALPTKNPAEIRPGSPTSGPEALLCNKGLVAGKPLGKMVILVYFVCCFGQVFGQSWPQDPFERVRFEQWCRTHLKLAPETNYKAMSWPFPGLRQKLKFKMME